MAITKRSFVYRSRIRVSAEDYDLARTGKKTCTIRLGTLTVEGSRIDLYDGSRRLPVEILSVDSELLFKSLDIDHAKCENFSTVEELREDLRKYYKNIDDNQPVTVIRFRLI